MILLSYLIKKFEYIRPLLDDLRTLVRNTDEKATGIINEDGFSKMIGGKLQSLANIQIYLKNLKEIACSQLAKAIKRDNPVQNINLDDSDAEDANDPFLKNFREEETDEMKERKRKEEEFKKSQEELQRKMDQFMVLWLRQIVIYNTHFLLHTFVTSSNMSSLLDVRPSIVKATNIKYALISLMNPRLQSLQQVDNFKSMKRILDNIVTYFFRSFLSVKERSMVYEDLQKVKNNVIKYDSSKYMDFSKFFESPEEFKSFYKFMDLNYYISNVCEYELSLVGHSNKDYSQSTLNRVYDLYKNGIEVFKQQTEHITQFCFDNCENDICAFVMKDEGIRESKLLHSLTLRNRTEVGRDVFDGELENWSE